MHLDPRNASGLPLRISFAFQFLHPLPRLKFWAIISTPPPSSTRETLSLTKFIAMKIWVMTMDGKKKKPTGVRKLTGILGKRIQLDVQPSDTVDQVRALIQNMEGTSPG